MLVDGEGMGWGTRLGKVQGRNHGLKVRGVHKKLFVRGSAKSGRGRRSKLVSLNIFSFILYLF